MLHANAKGSTQHLLAGPSYQQHPVWRTPTSREQTSGMEDATSRTLSETPGTPYPPHNPLGAEPQVQKTGTEDRKGQDKRMSTY